MKWPGLALLEESDSVATRTWQDRLGGPWVIAWQSYLITSVFAGLALASVEKITQLPFSQLLKWLEVYLLGLIAAGLVNLVLITTIYRTRRIQSIPVVRVLFGYASTSLAYSSACLYSIHLLNLHTETPGYLRISFSVIAATWWGSVLTIFLDFQDEHKKIQAKVIENAVSVEIAAMQENETSRRFQEAIEAQIYNELENARAMISTDQDQKSWKETTELLQQTAEKTVRALSTNLLRQETIEYPRTSFFQLLKNVLYFQSFGTLTIVMIDIIGAGPAQLLEFGFSRGFYLVLLIASLIILVCNLSNYAMRRYPHLHVQIYLCGYVLLETSILIRTHYREIWKPGSAPLSWQILQLILGTTVVFLGSIFGAWKDYFSRNNRNFISKINETTIASIAQSREIVKLTTEASRSLHGAVQTRLISCAMVIEQASLSGDVKRINEAITEALLILNSPLRNVETSATIKGEIIRKVSLWEGLCVFDLALTNEFETEDEGLAMLVGRVVEEGISNAIRHGKAKNIEIIVLVNHNLSIDIQIKDDGVGPKHGIAGLGSALLEQASSGKWSLNKLEAGTLLKVSLPPRN